MPGGRYQDGIETLLPTLRCFQSLKTLAPADVSSLKVWCDPPGCGNAYMGPAGQRLLGNIHRAEVKVKKRVAKLVFISLPKLEELWIGDCSRASIVGTEFGKEISLAYAQRPKKLVGPWEN